MANAFYFASVESDRRAESKGIFTFLIYSDEPDE
jgi:hypothetical protein